MQNGISLTIRCDQNCKVKSSLANITYVADECILATGRSQDGAELCQLFVASSGSRNQVFDLQYNVLLLSAFFKSCPSVPPHGDEDLLLGHERLVGSCSSWGHSAEICWASQLGTTVVCPTGPC